MTAVRIFQPPPGGSINVNINDLNGSGLLVVFVNMFGSTSGSAKVNPIHVNITGLGSDTVSVLGADATVSSDATMSSTVPPAEVYQITSTKTANGLTIFTTDGPGDTLTYNTGAGSNSVSLQNQYVAPGNIVFNSLLHSSGTDTYVTAASVGSGRD